MILSISPEYDAYKYAKKSHLDKKTLGFIRYVTDGTLLIDLIKSPSLKKN